MSLTATVLLPIHEKPEDVVQASLAGLDGQEADEVIIVLDRVRPALRDIAQQRHGASLFVRLDGPPGWRSPCIAFNAGLEKVTSDITVVQHSDEIQSPGNVALVKRLIEANPNHVIFGRVEESQPELCTGPGSAGPILCASYAPRALVFLLACRTQLLKDIDGWDEAFQAGVCYEDDDLTARLWKTGANFQFHDAFSAIHQSHERAYYKPAAIARNRAIMLQKHGTETFFQRQSSLNKIVQHREPGITTWTHA